ncbi:MAG: hypothetical protein SGILL_009886 [Bacillariaceae sp.]
MNPIVDGHNRNQSLSEAVLAPQSVVQDYVDNNNNNNNNNANTSLNNDAGSVDFAEHHEALIGAEFRDPANVIKQPTLATLGDTPFADDGDEIVNHRVVATEIIKEPRHFISSDTILQNAIVLLDP